MQAKNEMQAIKALNTKVEGIIESGSNDNGSWVKYDDGTMICYGSISNSLKRATSLACGGYRTSGMTFSFPVQFTEIPQITVNDTTALGYSNSCRANPTVSTFLAYWWGINSSSTESLYKADYVAIGKWK